MKKIAILILGIGLSLQACKKEEFLAAKPRTSLLVPTTLDDFQKLLDNSEMNVTGILGEISADDYYIYNKKAWEALTISYERNGYIWADDIYQGRENIAAWNIPYNQILYANVVLEGLEALPKENNGTVNFNWIRGWAHFIRGHAFFNLAQQFTLPYDESTAAQNLGLPIRLKSAVMAPVKRADLELTYQQIIADINMAVELLPNRPPGLDRNRPYKVAAFGLLARIYLSMRKYDEALLNAEKSLQLYHKLIDFNSLNTTTQTPIVRLNDETLFNAQFTGSASSQMISTYRVAPNVLVDSLLYSSYANNDLRKSILFTTVPANGKAGFKASYVGNTIPFSGIAVDEIYLIKAECEARMGNYRVGLAVLDDLLVNRWKSGTYVKQLANNSAEAIRIILTERRKELPFRGLRWLDLRRLNLEGESIELKRVIDGQIYVLPAKSIKYALPIPSDEIRLSGIEQNKR